jgi:hypothetical protein
LSVEATELGETVTWGTRVVGIVGRKVVGSVFAAMSEDSEDRLRSGNAVDEGYFVLMGGSLSSPFLMRSTMESTSVPESLSALPFTPCTCFTFIDHTYFLPVNDLNDNVPSRTSPHFLFTSAKLTGFGYDLASIAKAYLVRLLGGCKLRFREIQ